MPLNLQYMSIGTYCFRNIKQCLRICNTCLQAYIALGILNNASASCGYAQDLVNIFPLKYILSFIIYHLSLEMDPANSERRTIAKLRTNPSNNSTRVLLSYPALYTSFCTVNTANFPFDTQVGVRKQRKTYKKQGKEYTNIEKLWQKVSYIHDFAFDFCSKQ